ncbi:hypothetical protein H5410_031249 [Solanum commersonii]|uniref:Uncharacterized protein n=1 Tax=Solanum commersonii TaxID=4109 RepID=A0A9J5YJC7_SOLCO|nr:hypothetical protein H5410_031249 [Solanum commersonii]
MVQLFFPLRMREPFRYRSVSISSQKEEEEPDDLFSKYVTFYYIFQPQYYNFFLKWVSKSLIISFLNHDCDPRVFRREMFSSEES